MKLVDREAKLKEEKEDYERSMQELKFRIAMEKEGRIVT